MLNHRYEFIEYAMACKVLRFGRFTLKSGRESPYFFNAGLFNTGERLNRLAGFYAAAFMDYGIEADMVYGPAYKGIPLACSLAMTLAERSGQAIPFAFNRKETKDHGEGGDIVGSPLQGKVLIVDDVITAGTSVRESVEIITSAGAQACGVLIALDRQERGAGDLSATQEVTERYGLPVYPVIGLDDIVAYLEAKNAAEALETIRSYRTSFGVSQ